MTDQKKVQEQDTKKMSRRNVLKAATSVMALESVNARAALKHVQQVKAAALEVPACRVAWALALDFTKMR